MSATETEKIADVIVAAVRAATAPIVARCTALETQVAALEARAPVPGPKGDKGERGDVGPKGHDGMGTPGKDGKDGRDGTDAPPVDVEDVVRRAAALVPVPKDGKDGRDGKDGADAMLPDLDALAARAAALVPIPKDGADGLDGKDGKDGKDGRDGLPGLPGRDGEGKVGEKGADGAPGRDGTLEGASLDQIDARSWRLVRADGTPLTGVFKAPVVLDCGVYRAGVTYEKGDGVTFGGSFWIAQDATSEKPGDGATKWRLAVKAGREGREGKPGKDGAPGPRGEKGESGRNYT